MVLEINSNKPLLGVQSKFVINPVRHPGTSRYYASIYESKDSLNTNTDLTKYLNENAITEMIQANSEISKICEAAKIPVKMNMKVLNDLAQNHLPQTKTTALGIVNNLPQDFKSAVNMQALQEASVLHDIGKVLIPDNIINKTGSLTPEESNIMQKHSILGYELLKTQNLSKETLYLIKNHHQNAQKTGYPVADDAFVSDINLQIISVADMYSALREKRSYKPEYTKNQALAIIHKEMNQGKIHPYVFKALVDYANEEEEKLNKLKPQGQVFHLKPVNSLSA